ncbi:MAG: hypothetical protein K8R36_00165 [Planctomycetales bacterium]|nr:hypothetical protein [Planctomycetales bacterium]
MDQHPSDSRLELDSATSLERQNSGNRLPPGRAWFVMDDDEADQAMLLACERGELLGTLLDHVEIQLRARCFTVMTDEVVVPVIVVLLRIQGSEESAQFSAWVNELSPRTSGILDRLAMQSHLLIALIDEDGQTVGTSLARNLLSSKAESFRDWVTKLARNSPWTQHQFAAARAYIQSLHATNEDLWARFNEDSSGSQDDRELIAIPA